MRRLFLFSYILMLSFSLEAQQQVEDEAFSQLLESMLQHKVAELSVDEAMKMDDAIFLDAREKREFEVSHIGNAQWVGYNTFKMKRVDAIEKERPVIVYCSIGARSEDIANRLKKKGFNQVYNLYGGIFEWKNQGYPVVNETGVTEEVHAFDENWGVWLKKGKKVYK